MSFFFSISTVRFPGTEALFSRTTSALFSPFWYGHSFCMLLSGSGDVRTVFSRVAFLCTS